MSAPQFTPGPWYLTEAAEDLGYYRVREEASDYVLATTDDGGHPDPKFALPAKTIEANAHLIAASPGLYAALEKLAHRVLEYVGEFAEIEGLESDAEVRALAKDGLAALSKARGER